MKFFYQGLGTRRICRQNEERHAEPPCESRQDDRLTGVRDTNGQGATGNKSAVQRTEYRVSLDYRRDTTEVHSKTFVNASKGPERSRGPFDAILTEGVSVAG